MLSSDHRVIDGYSSEPDTPNYITVEIPTKPPEAFTYQERRAYLLRQIRAFGHPSMISQVEAADRYGVSQAQISKDLDRFAASVREHVVDRGRRALTVDSVVQRAIRGLLEEEAYRDAARTAMEWDEWLTKVHDLEEMARELEEVKQRR